MSSYLTNQTNWILFFSALLATSILTPWVMKLARRLSIVDRGGYRRVTKDGLIPLMGGLAVAAPFLAVCLFGYFSQAGLFAATSRPHSDFLVLAGGCVAILILGVFDDKFSLRARTKLAAQVLVAVFLCWAGQTMTALDLPVVGHIELALPWGIAITVLWLVGLTNAFNIIDGVDGLAAGIALIASIGFMVLGGMVDRIFVVLLGAALAGSLVAFLAFNFPPARVFLGDTGSMFLGFALASMALMGDQKSQAAAIFLAPILMLGFPILETLVSMGRRFLRGQPLFAADDKHTHHRLFRRGLSQRQTVLLLYGVAILLTIAAILQHVVPPQSKWVWIPYAVYLLTVLGIAWVAGYIGSPEAMGVLFRRRSRNALLNAMSRYAVLALSTDNGGADADDILGVVRKQTRLSFVAAWLEEGRVLIGSSGSPLDDSGQTPRLDSIERFRVKGLNGNSIIVRFQFDHAPAESEIDDVSACLARIFEESKIRRTALSKSSSKILQMSRYA